MIGPLLVSAVGQQVLTNVSENACGALVVQATLLSGSGLTFQFRSRLTGSGAALATAPTCYSTDVSTGTAQAAGTVFTPTTTPRLLSIICDGRDVILDVLTNSGNGVLQLCAAPITGGT